MEHRKQILTWRCGPCDRWVSVEVEPDVSPRCPTCGTHKNPLRPGLDALTRVLEENRSIDDESA